MKLRHSIPLSLSALAVFSSLTGCGGISLWPFGGNEKPAVRAIPAGATEYRCAGNKRFFLRITGNDTLWLIYPDREIRLERSGNQASRYSNGIANLELGETATLNDGPAIAYTECRAVPRQ